MHRFIILVLIIGICGASNYITNGDFEQALTDGWLQSTSGTNTIITRGTNYHPDPDYEAYVRKYGYGTSGTGYATLYQIVDIPTTQIEFSVDAKLYAWDNHASAWAGTAVIIGYLDASNTLLGETRICARSAGCPWQNSANMHIILAPDSSWHNYNFNINDELSNVPAVNPSQVQKIQVSLYSHTVSC